MKNEASVVYNPTVGIRLDPNALSDIWHGMNGPICVIYPTLNSQQIIDHLVYDLDDESSTGGRKFKRLGISPEQIDAIIKRCTRSGAHLIEGDAIALDHINRILREFYPVESLHYKSVWNFGSNIEEIEVNPDFQAIREDNVVLICGPGGNPISKIFLREAGLSWLFISERPFRRCIRRTPDDMDPLQPDGRPPSLKIDVGVFFRHINPFNPEKRFYAAMGSYSYGTQAAAAIGCTVDSASELIELQKNKVDHHFTADYGAWVKAWRGDLDKGELLHDYADRELKCQIYWPHPKNKSKWDIHSNIADLTGSMRTLKDWILKKNLPDIIYLRLRSTSMLLNVTYIIAALLIVFGISVSLCRDIISASDSFWNPLSYFFIIIGFEIFLVAFICRKVVKLLERKSRIKITYHR